MGEKSKFWPQFAIIAPIIVAVIACIGAILAALAGTEPFATWMVAYLPSTATPTVVISDVPPFSTITHPVSTSTLDVPCTFSQSCAPGQDWQHECISKIWVIFPELDIPSVDGSGCYQQPVWDFISTKNGGLYILAQHRNLISAEEYGIFAQLPQSGTVNLKIDLDVVDNGEIWVGIFSKPDIYSYGMLIVVPPGSVKEHNFGIRSMPDQKRMEVTEIYKNKLGIYSLGFDLYNGEVNAITENVVHDDQKLAFPSASRWLFIGYRAKLEIGNGTTDIEALIKDLVITPN